jgi:thioredoxin-like negative regulator of GroEL
MPHNEHVNELVQSSYQKPLVITFTAEWIGSSFLLETVLKRISKIRYDLDFRFFDSDEVPKLAAYFDVTEIPTSLYLDKGEIVDRFSHLMSQRKIESWLDNYSKKKRS